MNNRVEEYSKQLREAKSRHDPAICLAVETAIDADSGYGDSTKTWLQLEALRQCAIILRKKFCSGEEAGRGNIADPSEEPVTCP